MDITFMLDGTTTSKEHVSRDVFLVKLSKTESLKAAPILL